MSTTVPIGTTGNGVDDVRSYVAAVRARLDDLPPDVVEELTGGLEADLTEALAGDPAGPRSRFGDPAAYADELRSSAGLAPRSGGGDRGGFRAAWTGAGERVRAQPQYEPVRDFLLVIRPVWWVARGLLLAGFVVLFLGLAGFVGWFLMLLAAIASVEVGRRSPLATPAARGLVVAANVVAAIAAPIWLLGAAFVGGGSSVDNGTYVEQYPVPSGVTNNGETVYNIFAYDAQGNPLQDVRLYDERGRALAQDPNNSTYWDDGDADGNENREWALVPKQGVGPDQPRNVYPLLRQPLDQDFGTASQPAQEAKRPFENLPPLFAVPAPSASVTPTAEPSESATAPPPVTPTPGPAGTQGP